MNSDLTRRIAFTLGALLVYRIGTYIPLPGIDLAAWERIFRANSSGMLGMLSTGMHGMLAGNGLRRMAILALGLTPYLTAAVLIQLISMVPSWLGKHRKSGEKGRNIIETYVRCLAVLLAAMQSYGIALGLEGAGNIVADPGYFFRLSTVVTFTGGVVFL